MDIQRASSTLSTVLEYSNTQQQKRWRCWEKPLEVLENALEVLRKAFEKLYAQPLKKKNVIGKTCWKKGCD